MYQDLVPFIKSSYSFYRKYLGTMKKRRLLRSKSQEHFCVLVEREEKALASFCLRSTLFRLSCLSELSVKASTVYSFCEVWDWKCVCILNLHLFLRLWQVRLQLFSMFKINLEVFSNWLLSRFWTEIMKWLIVWIWWILLQFGSNSRLYFMTFYWKK